MRKLNLKEQVQQLTQLNKTYVDMCADLSNHVRQLVNENKQLTLDKQWLKQLSAELSGSINAGAKEGSFPRR